MEDTDSATKVEVDSDHFTYVDDPAFPWPTRVDDGGRRWFLQRSLHYQLSEGDWLIHPRFHLADDSELADILAAKSSSDAVTSHNSQFASFTIQAIKARNEDRFFVHSFDRGTVFGVLDGHNGHRLSEKAAQELPGLLAASLGDAIARTQGLSLPEVTQVVEAAFTSVVLDFDEALLEGLNDTIREFEEEYKDFEWEKEHIQYAMYIENKGAHRPAFALEGSTALLGFIPASSDHVWVACVGDSEAHHARLDGGKWAHTPLNEIHCSREPSQAEKLRCEHPGEDVLKNGRVLGVLPLTRALGDYLLKSPIEDVVKYYQFMRPSIVMPEWYDTAAQKYKTAPYISARPTFKHAALERGDMIMFATDGLRNILDIDSSLADSDKTDMFVTVAGHAVSGGTGHSDLARWEEKLGHRFLQRDAVKNPAAWTVQNILFGQDRLKFSREMTIEVPLYKRWQDDITLLIVTV